MPLTIWPPPPQDPGKYANDTGFQIISAGYDGQFGPGANRWGGPAYAYGGAANASGSDDMSNFHPTRLGAGQ